MSDISCLKVVRELYRSSGSQSRKGITYIVLQDLMEDDWTVDSTWKMVKESFVSAWKEVLRPKKYHQKDWISAETLSKILVRKDKNEAVN